MTASTQQVNGAITYYAKKYSERYGIEPPDLKRFRDKWAYKACIEQYNYDIVKQLIDYYMACDGDMRTVKWFANNYEVLFKQKQEEDADKEEVAKLLKESRERARLWRESKQGTTGTIGSDPQ